MSRKYKKRVTANAIADLISEAAREVHRTLGGPGLLACVYEEALVFELQVRGVSVERRMVVPFVYKGRRLATELRLAIAERKVLLDCRCQSAGESSAPLDAGVSRHLRLLDLPLAVVIDFGSRDVVEGTRQLVNPAAREPPRARAS